MLFLLFSCGSDRKTASMGPAEQTELPPSLSGRTDGIELVRLSDKEQQELNIRTVRMSSDPVRFVLNARGVVFPAPGHSSIVSTPLNGQIIRISKFEGARVSRGEVIFQIQSLEFGTLVSEYLQAFAEERFQRNRLARIRQLVEETISSQSELERATAEFDRASAIARATYSRLRAVGVSEHEIRQFTEIENITPLLSIHSPIDGIVESTFVELGQSVNALENLSRLLDITDVLVRGYLAPEDAGMVAPGDSVRIFSREKRSEMVATILSVNPGLDEASRSVIVNIIIPARSGWPKPGENLRLEIYTSAKTNRIAIPVEAITYDGNQAIVFVHHGRGIYEKRALQITALGDQTAYAEAGLADGEEVAVTHVFSLKALLRYSIIAEE